MIRDSLSAAARKPEKEKLGPVMQGNGLYLGFDLSTCLSFLIVWLQS